jgi:2-polyprenyl-3-methyl-5-hydroxy-6-metoxy-1,4-benzoquinol methylase
MKAKTNNGYTTDRSDEFMAELMTLKSAVSSQQFRLRDKIIHMCPICGCSRVLDFFVKADRTLLICEDCRHVWWDSFPSEEELGDYYRRQYTQAHSQEDLQAAAREYYAGHLRDLLHRVGRRAEECRICDYGCSIPVLLIEAGRAGFRQTLGVDYCEQTQAYGAAHGVRVLLPEQLESLPDGSIDIVRFSHTLEHSRDPVGVVAAVLQKVRPNGLVYITQPNFPVFRFGPSAHDLKDTVYPEHLHFFSPLSLLKLALRLNLCVRQFFTHQNEESVIATSGDQLDPEYSKFRLAAYKGIGESAVHELGNYPHYAGENSALYAFKA